MNKDKEKLPYLRIGCEYKRIVKKPLVTDDYVTILINWNKQTIIDDNQNNRNIINEIPKYLGTVVKPSHNSYVRDVEGFYNTYEPLTCSPIEGRFDTILYYLKHIFQEQIDLGLDYFKILYNNPLEKLPVISLISEERGTGKSTFLNLLKLIFGLNMTINSPENIQSRFNYDLIGKLLIAAEEVEYKLLSETENIKYLSTSFSFKAEAKGKERQEQDFFAKFILLSNHENSFIKIEPGETRFWVLKIQPFKEENTELLDRMKSEIPHFLYYLKTSKISYEKKTRMWFLFKDYETKALKRVINHNKNKLEIELINVFITIMENFDVEVVSFQPNDLANILSKSFQRTDMTRLRKIIKESWGLKPVKNSLSYKRYSLLSDGSFAILTEKGRYYTITKDWIKEHYDDLMN